MIWLEESITTSEITYLSNFDFRYIVMFSFFLTDYLEPV